MRPRLPLLPTVVLTAVTLLGCPHASAAPAHDDAVVTTTTISDPDDTDGPLDLVAVSHAVRERGPATQIRYTLRWQAPVEATDLHRRQRLVIGELDRDGRPGAERSISVYARGTQLHADLISNATREVIRPLHVRMLGQRLRVRAPRRLVGVRRIFWYSLYHRTGVPSCGWDDGYPVTCSDSVPDDGWLRLPAAAWP